MRSIILFILLDRFDKSSRILNINYYTKSNFQSKKVTFSTIYLYSKLILHSIQLTLTTHIFLTYFAFESLLTMNFDWNKLLKIKNKILYLQKFLDLFYSLL